MQTFTFLAACLAAANTVVAAPWGPGPTGTWGGIQQRDVMKPTGTYGAGDLQKRSWPTASGWPQPQARDEEAVENVDVDAGSNSNWTAPRLAPRLKSGQNSLYAARDEVAAKVQSALQERADAAAPPTPVSEEQPTLRKRSDPEPEPEPQAPVENREENHEESNQESQQQQDSQQQEHHEEHHEEQQQERHDDQQQQQQEEHHDDQQQQQQQEERRDDQQQQEEHHDDQQQQQQEENHDDQQQQNQQQGELEQNRQDSNWTVPELSPRANFYTPLVDGEDDYES